jgi:hypothetical protein
LNGLRTIEYRGADAKTILQSPALSRPTSTATLDGAITGNVRYALNNVTSGIVSDATWS